MNAENFHEYLKNPSMLYQISYQELKSLVLQYPWSPNLRYLLMVKSLLDSNKEYEKNLGLAALYSIDRKKLFRQVKLQDQLRTIQDNYALNEDFLELKDLSTLEEIMESPSSADQKAPAQQAIERDDILDIESLSDLENKEPKRFFGDDDDLDLLEDLLDDDEFETGGPAAPEFGLTDTGEKGERQPDQEIQEPGTHPESLEDLIEELTEERMDEDTQLPGAPELVAVESSLAEVVEVPVEDFSDEAESIAILTAILEGLTFESPAMVSEEMESERAATGADEAPAGKSKTIPFEITNESGTDAGMIEPAPKTSFNSWLRQRQPPRVGLLSGAFMDKVHASKENVEPKEEPEIEDRAKDIAAKSIREDEWIASETLAALLEAQGHYDKAIGMYERLSLKYPQKSSFFARKIEKLKRK